MSPTSADSRFGRTSSECGGSSAPGGKVRPVLRAAARLTTSSAERADGGSVPGLTG